MWEYFWRTGVLPRVREEHLLSRVKNGDLFVYLQHPKAVEDMTYQVKESKTIENVLVVLTYMQICSKIYK